jgi:hypothetical protein
MVDKFIWQNRPQAAKARVFGGFFARPQTEPQSSALVEKAHCPDGTAAVRGTYVGFDFLLLDLLLHQLSVTFCPMP